jgi:hypothetical protein
MGMTSQKTGEPKLGLAHGDEPLPSLPTPKETIRNRRYEKQADHRAALVLARRREQWE